ncbi:hypothetical protein J6590_049094 [Homalodisca vitripennis]|nr:hypothetical protein J6590_049094 [Homalodisca vitripennis]
MNRNNTFNGANSLADNQSAGDYSADHFSVVRTTPQSAVLTVAVAHLSLSTVVQHPSVVMTMASVVHIITIGHRAAARSSLHQRRGPEGVGTLRLELSSVGFVILRVTNLETRVIGEHIRLFLPHMFSTSITPNGMAWGSNDVFCFIRI